jgi:transcriptional regulator with XRE-family HTH domain
MEEKRLDPSMNKVRALFEKSGLTLNELGLKMDCPPEVARQSAFQFLKTRDPHISMLRRFAKAVGVPLEELIAERKRKGQPG